MSLMSRIAGRFGFVRQAWADQLLWLLTGGMQTKAGVSLTHLQALQISTVLACTRAISEGVGALETTLRRRTAVGSERDTTSDAAWLLEEPNAWMTWQELVEALTAHAVLTGNGFALIQRGVRGQPIALLPLLPGWVQHRQLGDWSIEYLVTLPSGESMRLGLADVLHIRGLSWDTIGGLEIVKLARESIGLAAAIEWTQAGHFGKGGTPSGALVVDGALTPQRAEEIRARWQAAHGAGQGGSVAVLGQGARFQQFELNFASAQTMETRRLQVEEICRAFGVFPQVIGAGDKAPTYASAEAFFSAHAVHTLGPWARRWEHTLKRDLLTPRQRAEMFFEVDVESILRADTKATGDFLRQMVDGGIMTPNEARRRLRLNALADGDQLRPAANIVGRQGQPAEPTPAA